MFVIEVAQSEQRKPVPYAIKAGLEKEEAVGADGLSEPLAYHVWVRQLHESAAAMSLLQRWK